MKNNSNRELEKRNFSGAIFGSARIAKGDANYKLVYNLAKMISKLDIDIATGGGPGLMNAASEGHHTVRQTKKPQSIGLRIKLDTEEIVGLPFMPVGTGKEWCNCRDRWFTAGSTGTNDYPAAIKIISAEIINNFQLIFLDPVNSGDTLYKEIGIVQNLDGFKQLSRIDLHIQVIPQLS